MLIILIVRVHFAWLILFKSRKVNPIIHGYLREKEKKEMIK